jgi:thiosulfate dehydrogenase
MKFAANTLFACFLVLVLVSAVSGSLPEQTRMPGDPIMGARLYDNWMLALDLKPPEGEQPLWSLQSENPRTGQVTWRCKECHGWDYKGAEGAYGPQALRYTGFPNLSGMVGASQDEVVAWLDGTNNASHNFLQFTHSIALDDLAVFLRTMQVDMALIIDYETGKALGDEAAGRELYLQTCERCHGTNGRELNLGGGIPLYVGDLAAVDPWHTVHVVRFGTPQDRMPGTEEMGWSLRNVADLLTYAQSLPRGNPNYTITNDLPGELAVERQGEIGPIAWGAAAILLLIGGALAWGAALDAKKAST